MPLPAEGRLRYVPLDRVDGRLVTLLLLTITKRSVREGGVKQAYSRLSTHSRITDCKLDSVVHTGVCACMCGELILDLSCLGSNDLRPTVLGCQTADSIPPQVSRKESLRPFY